MLPPDLERPAADFTRCVSVYEHEKSVRGREWNGFARCLRRARTEIDIGECEASHPIPPTSSPGGETETPERRACEHLLTMTIEETEAESGQPLNLSSEQLELLLAHCLSSLWARRMDSSSYDEMLACLLASRSTEEFLVCE